MHMISKTAQLTNKAASLVKLERYEDALRLLHKAQNDAELSKRYFQQATADFMKISYDIDDMDIITSIEIPDKSSLRQDEVEFKGDCGDGMKTFSTPLEMIVHAVGDIDCHPTDKTIVDAVVRYNLGIVMTRLGRDDEAYAHFEKSISLKHTYSSFDVVHREAKFGFFEIAVLHNLGHIDYRNGRYDKALSKYHAALERLAEDHYDSPFATLDKSLSLNCIGMVIMHLSQGSVWGTEKSLHRLSRALNFARSLKDNDHRHQVCDSFMCEKLLATIMNNIGRVLVLRGEAGHALNLYEQVFKIRGRMVGEDHPDTVAMYLPMVEALLLQGGQTKRVLEMLHMYIYLSPKNLLDRDLPVVFTFFAEAYIELNDLSKAVQFYEKALRKLKSACVSDHEQMAQILNSLGNLLCMIGKHGSALKVYQEGLDLEDQIYNSSDSRIIVTILNIARVYRHTNDFHCALEKYNEALRLQRRIKGGNRLDLALILEDVGFINSKLGRWKDSISPYLEALGIKMKVLGKYHFDVSTLMNSIGLAYLDKAQYVDARYYFEGSLLICFHHDGDPDPTTRSFTAVEVMINIATTHLKQCNYTKALDLFEKCQKLLEEVSDGSYQDIKDKNKLTIALTLYEGIELVYEKMDCPMNTIFIRKEAIKLRRAIAAIGSANKSNAKLESKDGKLRKPPPTSSAASRVSNNDEVRMNFRRASVNDLDFRKNKPKETSQRRSSLSNSTL